MSTEPSGDAKICCLSNQTIHKNNSESYNLGNDDIKEIFNNSQICRNRKDMLNGVRISDCSHCWNEEDAGGISQRINNTKQWLEKKPDLVKLIEEASCNDHKVSYDPIYYDFRFGNMCNLKCRSCGSLNSIQINKEYDELQHKHWLFSETGERYNNLNDWYQTDTFKNNIYSNLDKIEKIYITGGEPTLIEENYELLRRLIEIDRAKNVSIMFNTNMTNLRDDFYDLISQFKNAEIAISIEGVGGIQEYLRYPSKWTHIDKNIRRIMQLPGNISIFAVPVVQIVNLAYISEFFEYIEQLNKECGYYRIKMLPILLDSPKFLDLGILPLDYKLKCWKKIEDYVSKKQWLLTDSHFMGRYNNIKQRCYDDLYNVDLLKHFKTYNKILDNNRSQHLKDVNFELFELIRNVK